MDAEEIVAVGTSIAAIAAAIAAIAACVSLRGTTIVSSRYHSMNALYDLDRQLITFPELAAIYDNKGDLKNCPDTPRDIARREALLDYYFNLFEAVFTDHHHTTLGVLRFESKAEHASYEAWERWMADLLRGSKQAREYFGELARREVFSEDFVERVRQRAHV
jgi:hypothetical protein